MHLLHLTDRAGKILLTGEARQKEILVKGWMALPFFNTTLPIPRVLGELSYASDKLYGVSYGSNG